MHKKSFEMYIIQDDFIMFFKLICIKFCSKKSDFNVKMLLYCSLILTISGTVKRIN